jgi:UDP-glucose 4-epimerase
VPIVLEAAAGRRAAVPVFGDDYPTRDGTCVRDFVHVDDLARAHHLALQYLQSGGGSLNLNLGHGAGFSVLEVIEAARRVTGKPIQIERLPRRPGDPPELVASGARARQLLGWQPVASSLENIVTSAWRWHTR